MNGIIPPSQFKKHSSTGELQEEEVRVFPHFCGIPDASVLRGKAGRPFPVVEKA
ncbi:hypothetical protein [Magnetospirillum molischianum]|uniref:hypothetical protein n=1 Tax=Magnetospirillum molischianum TaxID=1083 RepID=UPI0002E67114|nr:hypothetical protein [Magnetospirillum molischianum]